ncbi:hypothetical protein [Halorhodospira neutriphila]|uniref:DUF4064 domain-containing protein n=1 Tax=Halorhodospira neutriphila TaxID=168379 RepID=A0ABS1E1U7_9GAMM|nr:hypothetical protein [Halorhodospira neutriphila]MBK1725686.1 hypothetical protein [Halorhodospira neutriphila]
MQKAGGIITLIAGVFAVFAAIFTLMVGGVNSAFETEHAQTVVWLGWGGVLFSFLNIVLGAVAIGAKSKKPGAFIIVSSILGSALGGTFVALFMALSLAGGILATIGVSKSAGSNSGAPSTA